MDCYIIRGLPGSGKSTLASNITSNPDHLLATDDYFTKNGIYTFNPCHLLDCLAWNLNRVVKLMKSNVSPIVIDDAHSQRWEVKPYVQQAIKYNYTLHFLEPDTPWWKARDVDELVKRNKHNVSIGTIRRMLERWDDVFDVDLILNSPLPKLLFIIRGLPGSGKQDLMECIMENEDYKKAIVSKTLSEDVRQSIHVGYTPIFLCNIHSRKSDVKEIVQLGIEFGYRIIISEPNTPSWVARDTKALAINSNLSEQIISDYLKTWEDDFTIDNILK
ncbi:NEDD4-binding protein 2 [Globomyces sp. JEL0801]|nr:NEDD4-binding protein 2 [Globomyces sp. JEL0801]